MANCKCGKFYRNSGIGNLIAGAFYIEASVFTALAGIFNDRLMLIPSAAFLRCGVAWIALAAHAFRSARRARLICKATREMYERFRELRERLEGETND